MLKQPTLKLNNIMKSKLSNNHKKKKIKDRNHNTQLEIKINHSIV